MSDLGSVLIDIDLMIARIEQIRKIEPGPIIAKAMHEHVSGTIGASTDAYGSPWQSTQSGGRPLKNAAAHLKIYSSKGLAGISIEGSTNRQVEGRHHHGNVKGGIKRPIIPTRLIPIALANLIKLRLSESFHGRARNSIQRSS
jgi:hypothetical protein